MFFLWLLLCFAVIAGAVYLLQGSFIYFPHRYPIQDLIRVAEQNALALWPTPDRGYRGLVSGEGAAVRGTIIVFHGNGGSALDRLHYLAALEPLGFRVVLAEYPGYGAREGRPGEQTLVADAKATVRLVERDFRGPLYIWGESLGTGVATAVAADASLAVEGLTLITPFSSLPDVAQSIYWYFPVKWLLRDRYNNVTNLRGFEKPIAILVAGRDELIPGEQAQELYDSLTARKRMWVFEDSGHNTWPSSPEATWWEEVTNFHDSTQGGGKGQRVSPPREIMGNRWF